MRAAQHGEIRDLGAEGIIADGSELLLILDAGSS
jgi:hypothetical protein